MFADGMHDRPTYTHTHVMWTHTDCNGVFVLLFFFFIFFFIQLVSFVSHSSSELHMPIYPCTLAYMDNFGMLSISNNTNNTSEHIFFLHCFYSTKKFGKSYLCVQTDLPILLRYRDSGTYLILFFIFFFLLFCIASTHKISNDIHSFRIYFAIVHHTPE